VASVLGAAAKDENRAARSAAVGGALGDGAGGAGSRLGDMQMASMIEDAVYIAFHRGFELGMRMRVDQMEAVDVAMQVRWSGGVGVVDGWAEQVSRAPGWGWGGGGGAMCGVRCAVCY
jgi:hypothetical protein